MFFADHFEATPLCVIPFSAGPVLPSGFRGPCRSRWTGAGHGLFLISLKAVGTGLNLVAADIVIHFDPWWNQAAQDQTTDRAHRIGQQAHVQVYKLISKDTLEEKSLEPLLYICCNAKYNKYTRIILKCIGESCIL